jgi:hypothetical protein
MHMSNSTLLLPTDYYDNVLAFPSVVTIVRKLCDNPLRYALKLVKKPKNNVTEEYTTSLADLLVIRGRPHFTVVQSYILSVGFETCRDRKHGLWVGQGYIWRSSKNWGKGHPRSGKFLCTF